MDGWQGGVRDDSTLTASRRRLCASGGRLWLRPQGMPDSPPPSPPPPIATVK